MDNNIIIIGLIALGLIIGTQIAKAIRWINPAKAKDLIDAGAVVIDVRDSHEYRSGHIKKALNIPVNSLKNKAKKSIPDKNADVIVYCQSGSRSKAAYSTLKRLGYTNVHDLGGIGRWKYGTVI